MWNFYVSTYTAYLFWISVIYSENEKQNVSYLFERWKQNMFFNIFASQNIFENSKQRNSIFKLSCECAENIMVISSFLTQCIQQATKLIKEMYDIFFLSVFLKTVPN